MQFHKKESEIKSEPVYMNPTTLWQRLLELRVDRPTRLGQGHVDGRLEYLYDLHPVRLDASLPAGSVFSADSGEARAIEERQARRREAEKRWIRENAPLRPVRR